MKKIPTKNNAGHSRKPLDESAIIKNDQYLFRSVVIKRFMPESEFKKFVSLYNSKRKLPREFVLNKKELKALEIFDSGKLSINELQRAFKVKSISTMYLKLGKIYATRKTK